MIWPITLQGDAGTTNPWYETAREAAELAKSSWIRMVADMSLGAYRIYKAEGVLSDPDWPHRSMNELLEVAFRDKVIDSEEHSLVRRLRGLA